MQALVSELFIRAPRMPSAVLDLKQIFFDFYVRLLG